MIKYMVTMVENFSDGDSESGMCSPSSFDDLVEANSAEEAEMLANQKWDDASCLFVFEATDDFIREYEMLMSEC